MNTPPDILVDPDFLPDSDALFRALWNDVTWDESMRARKTASFGRPYDYSQMRYETRPMHPALVPVADRLEERLGFRRNNCLLNLYEGGDNTIGFHSDEIDNLAPGPGVAIVSLGQPRDLIFRRIADHDERHRYTLAGGSLLYMSIEVQHEWHHGIRRECGAGARISLTWRCVDDMTPET